MLTHKFEELSIKKQYRCKPKDKDVIPVGYDTETQDGLCKLLCDPSSFLHPCSFDDILDFLTAYKRRGTVGFFYNLRYDFQALLKWLDPTYWDTLLERGQIDYNQFRITYIPGKLLRIKRGGRKGHTFNFYDISPFFGKGELNKVAKKYLGKEKKPIKGFDIAHLTNKDFLHPVIIEYCKYDAELTQDLANFWIELCHKQGVYPTTFISTASIAVRFFQSKCKIPTINAFLKPSRYKCLKIPWLTCAGPLTSVYKRGRFDACYEYDINSAYPSTIAKLPDISRGRFLVSKSGIPKDAYLGWVQARVNLWTDSDGFYFPPVPVCRKNASNFFPYGTFQTFMTLDEFRVLEKDLNLDLIAGLYWLPTHNLKYPFDKAVNEIYDIRQTIKDANISYFYKTIINSLFGKFLQRILVRNPDKKDFGKYRTGVLFNPCYASYILAASRIQIYKTLKTISKEHIIACFTDSVLVSKEYPALDEGLALGRWSKKSEGPLLIMGSGVYTLIHDGVPKTKLRGFHITNKVNLFTEAENQYKKTAVELPIRYNITLATALTRHCEGDMNLLVDDMRKIEINFDTKRFWLGTFSKVGEYLEKQIDSLPLIYGG